MREAEGRASGTVKNATGNKRAFTSYGGTVRAQRGERERNQIVGLLLGSLEITTLIGKWVDGKYSGRIVGLEG